jgi:phosphoglycolate phosphatase
MYKNILFDFDGTVFDTVEGITKSAQYALKKRGIDAELEALRCFAGPPLVDKFMEVYGFSREEAESATADFRQRYEPIGVRECRVFPGIKELLQQLIDRGFNVGIATSKPQHLAEWLLEQEGMTGLFKVVCGSSSEGNNNAKWQVLRRAMDALGATAEDSVLVGDTKYDVEGAKRCGVPCIGVRYGYAAPGELESAGAAAIAENLDELLQLLTK